MTDIEVWLAYQSACERRDANWAAISDVVEALGYDLTARDISIFGKVVEVTKRLVKRGLLTRCPGTVYCYEIANLLIGVATLSDD